MGHKTQTELRAEYAAWTVYPDRCAICWIPTRQLYLRFNRSLEMAHIISRARGGHAGNVVGNVLFLCSSCHGSEHNSGHTYEGVKWPTLMTGHLLKAKLELRELDAREMSEIGGYMARYICDLTRVSWPSEITAERLRWK